MLIAKKVGRFSPNGKIRKLWIPKQYLVHMDDMVARRRGSATKEKVKNERYPYHTRQKIKKEKPSKGNDVSPKERYVFVVEKSMNNPSRIKEGDASKVCYPSSCLTWTKMARGAV